jgi:hypothetical protein
MRPAFTILCGIALLAALGGCSRHRYELPARALEDPELMNDLPAAPIEEADYYALAWSPLNVAGRRVPSCPYEVVEEIEVRASSLTRGETWAEDRELATPRTDATLDPLRRREREQPGWREELAPVVPRRPESRLLDALRRKARALGGDAIVEIVLYRAPDGGGVALTLQNVELDGAAVYDRVTGKVIRFTREDCRQ